MAWPKSRKGELLGPASPAERAKSDATLSRVPLAETADGTVLNVLYKKVDAASE